MALEINEPWITSKVRCQNGYAYIDEDGMLTIHSKSIGIHLHMPMIADGIGIPMEKIAKAALPLIVAMFIALLIVTYIPAVSIGILGMA